MRVYTDDVYNEYNHNEMRLPAIVKNNPNVKRASYNSQLEYMLL